MYFNCPCFYPLADISLVRLARRTAFDRVHEQFGFGGRGDFFSWVKLLLYFLDQIAVAIWSAFALIAATRRPTGWIGTGVVEDFIEDRIDLLRLLLTFVPNVKGRRS